MMTIHGNTGKEVTYSEQLHHNHRGFGVSDINELYTFTEEAEWAWVHGCPDEFGYADPIGIGVPSGGRPRPRFSPINGIPYVLFRADVDLIYRRAIKEASDHMHDRPSPPPDYSKAPEWAKPPHLRKPVEEWHPPLPAPAPAAKQEAPATLSLIHI